jgi:mitogen-activated protein kinase kinase kinase 4
MEFCGDQCTLEKLCVDQSGLPEKQVRDYTKSLLVAVEALHERGIMHGDIKCANIFLKIIDPKHPENVVLKLGDFGCSIKFKDPIDSKNSNVKATGFRGTFCYMAPEVMAKSGAMDGKYEVTSDIWSLGCVVIGIYLIIIRIF